MKKHGERERRREREVDREMEKERDVDSETKRERETNHTDFLKSSRNFKTSVQLASKI